MPVKYSGRLPSIIARIRGGAMSAALVNPWRSHASIIAEPCSICGPVAEPHNDYSEAEPYHVALEDRWRSCDL
jgi:hypothetical protein